ncbi:MAG: aldehyde dehydrogenase family protein, partial [Pseudomonadota bacterium]
LVAAVAPALVGGNVCVVIAAAQHPLTAITLAEVLQASDVPAGVVNILTGHREELLPHCVQHDDIDALLTSDLSPAERRDCQISGAEHLQRQVTLPVGTAAAPGTDGLAAIQALQEIKTTWHPNAH